MPCDWWSAADDGSRGRTPVITEHNLGTHWESVQWICPVKMTWQTAPKLCWTVKVYPATATVTMSLGALERTA